MQATQVKHVDTALTASRAGEQRSAAAASTATAAAEPNAEPQPTPAATPATPAASSAGARDAGARCEENKKRSKKGKGAVVDAPDSLQGLQEGRLRPHTLVVA